MTVCINHPENGSIEHCEVCGDALCGRCLWYGDDGRRLCERHARAYERDGGTVQSPGLYEGEIHVEAPRPENEPGVYRGNETDLTAAAAAVFGAAGLMMWFGGSLCLPVAAGVLGLVALTSRRKGLHAQRVRWMGLFGVGMGVVSLLPLIFFGCLFVFSLGMAIAGSAVGP